jgi:predicted ATPase/DNA-binding XRE family transcriptional regulator
MFGALLKRYRETAGLSQEELAERAGLSANAIGALERGARQHPYPRTIRQLADALALGAAERQHLLFTARQSQQEMTAVAPGPNPIPITTIVGLPGHLTSLIGRDAETAVVRQLLGRADVRLLTLSGPGGVGKTRLALHVAEGAGAHFPDGVVFVSLSSLRDATLVPEAIAQALGLRGTVATPPLRAIMETVAGRELLLVLDNVEQVAEAAPEVASLLLGCPGLKILATSRMALRVRGEQEYRVPPLELPVAADAQHGERLRCSPAVQLFIARARAVRPNFSPTPPDMAAIAAICARLDGLPLAIELAAARIAVLPPQALLARLERGLQLLSGGARDLPARQQTMRDTIAWSHDLLASGERLLFRRLAAFDGGWTLDAAEVVCGAGALDADSGIPPDVLSGHAVLLDQSLLFRREGMGKAAVEPPSGEPRFGMLETIRAYALEQLTASGELALIRARHCAYYLALAEAAESQLRGAQQGAWLSLLEAELANIRAALGWSYTEGEPSAGLRLTIALGRFWQYHSHLREGRAWLERGLARPGTAPGVRAKALAVAGWLARNMGDLSEAAALLEQSLAVYRHLDPPDPSGLAATLDSLGDTAYFTDDHSRARALHEEALSLRRSSGDQWGEAMSLNSLGWVVLAYGEHDRAAPLLDEALALTRQLKDQRGTAMVLGSQGLVALARADAATATATLTASLRLFHELNNPLDVALQLIGLAATASMRGQDIRSARLYGAAIRLCEQNDLEHPDQAYWQRYYAPHLSRARTRLGTTEWTAALAEGAALTSDEAIAEALGEGSST